MNYNKLKVFYDVAKIRNQSRAARELYISQSTLSKHILDLEANFNTQLFQRTNRDLVLTDAGEALYQICQEIFSRESEMYRRVWEAAAKNIDSLRIATMRVNIIQHLPELHRKFNNAYPGIHLKLVRMDWSEVLRSVDAGDADIGVKPCIGEEYPEHISHYTIEGAPEITMDIIWKSNNENAAIQLFVDMVTQLALSGERAETGDGVKLMTPDMGSRS